jgi:predicted DNA-binding transcriptional regulator AlpA
MTDRDQQAYTVDEFCRAYAISRKALYDLWKIGQGPVSYKIGRSRRVSRSAAEAWQQALEAAASNLSARGILAV